MHTRTGNVAAQKKRQQKEQGVNARQTGVHGRIIGRLGTQS